VKYCRDLRLAGYSDWRLATLGDLQGIYDKTASAPGLSGPHGKDPFQFHVKGNLFLTGNPWAYGLWGNYGTEYVFDFNEGKIRLLVERFLVLQKTSPVACVSPHRRVRKPRRRLRCAASGPILYQPDVGGERQR